MCVCNIISKNCFTMELSTANVSCFCAVLWSCLCRAMQKLLWVCEGKLFNPWGGGREPSTSLRRTPPPESGQGGAALSLILWAWLFQYPLLLSAEQREGWCGLLGEPQLVFEAAAWLPRAAPCEEQREQTGCWQIPGNLVQVPCAS